MNNHPDYLLIKDLPGYSKGCIFTMGKNYIYYIQYNPDTVDYVKIDPSSKWDASEQSLLRFNIHQMENNPEWFLKIDEQVLRDLKIDKLLNNLEV
jgi:hypothetical protein